MRYSCADNIHWVKDADSVLLVNTETHETWTLKEADALIWEMLLVGHSFAKIVQIVAPAMTIAPEKAERLIQQIIKQWWAQNILVVEEDNGNHHG